MRKKNNAAVSNQAFSQGKLRLLVVLKVFFFIAIFFFLFRWQVLDHSKFKAQANNRLFKKEISSLRGDILASDGSILSYSEPRFDIYVYKDDKQGLVAAEKAGRQTRDEFVTKVAEILKVEEAGLREKLDKKSDWVRIAEKVTKQTRDEVLRIPTAIDPELYLDGLDYVDTSVRRYPEGKLAVHVLGFIGKDEQGYEVGSAGLEQYFDGVLKPQIGITSLETDSNQNIIAISDNEIKEARRGATIVTTIDKNIQQKVEKRLKEGVERYMARSGTVIIMDPRTGEILALANYPDYDPNSYSDVEDKSVYANIAINYPLEIGSVGKVYTMSAAVDQGKVTPGTVVIDGHSGCQKIIDQRVVCTYDKKPQGALTATDAMIKSDNLALFATAGMVGEKKLADYLTSFGLGSKTNIQLAGEDSGFIKPGDKWNQADLAAYSYGHSYFLTQMQAIVGLGALANHGKRMEPIIVKEMIDRDEHKIYRPRVVKEVLKPESVETMSDILYEVFKSNLYEDRYKDLAKYHIGMKSGTALIPYTSLTPPQNIPGYSNEVNATYVGYDASSKNSFIMIVNLSEPQTNPKLSYNNARLLWLDLFIDLKDDLGVPEGIE